MNSFEKRMEVLNDSKQDSVASILEFVQSNVGKIKTCSNKKVVLVCGNTGAGKTTLVLLLTKANLTSKEINTKEFMISDENDLISGISTTEAHTIIPNLMIHKDTIFYDCPGFNDTRGVENDISVSYVNQKLINEAASIKFLFAVNFNSVRNFSGDRRDFKSMAKHATTFIKNVDKYKDGIALIVTKVEKHDVNDADIINSIVMFLEQVQTDLENKNSGRISLQDKELNNRMIAFIAILLKKNDENEYERIGIVRLAKQIGPVNEIKFLQENRRAIKQIIYGNLSYVKKVDTDFGHTVSDETKTSIHKILDDLQIHLKDDVERICNEFKQNYEQKEESIVDLITLENMMLNAYRVLFKVKYEGLNQFEIEMYEAADKLKIPLSSKNKNKFSDDIGLVKFLQSVSDIYLSNSFNLTTGLENIIRYLDESHKWYKFLSIFHDRLSEYEVQKNIPAFLQCKEKVVRQCSTESQTMCRNIDDIDLKELAQKVGCEIYYTIETIQLNPFKLKILKLVLVQTMDSSLNILCEENKLRVKGYNVKISDIGRHYCDAINHIDVFAINNLFIDADIKKTGENAQLSFVAPKWYIIGDRKLILNGADGKPCSESAVDGVAPAENGKNGIPGKPGGSAGNFLGIGRKCFNDQYLEIHLNGGKGGNGQNGGRGTDGIKGDTPPIPKFFVFNPWRNRYRNKQKIIFNYFLYGRSSYNVMGNHGTAPGSGGNGGCGGKGGNFGNAFNAFAEDPKFIVSKNRGEVGLPGKGGNRGEAAENGDIIEAEYSHMLYFLNISGNCNQKHGGKTTDAADGIDGGNNENIENPAEPSKLDSKLIAGILNDYKNYLEPILKNNIHESILRDFIKGDLDIILTKYKASIEPKVDGSGFSNFFNSVKGKSRKN